MDSFTPNFMYLVEKIFTLHKASNIDDMNMPHVARELGTAAGVLQGQGPLVDDLNMFLVQAVIIIAICRVLSLLGTYLNQPKVIFEIIGNYKTTH